MFGRMRAVVAVGAVLAGTLLLSTPRESQAVPSFARQTGQPCATCHTIFPALTAYGRQFKLNGYVSNAGQVIQAKDVDQKEKQMLEIGSIPPISVMILTSWTETKKMQPDAEKNGDVLLPDQFSLFLAGQISPKAGAFIQATYTQVDDHFSWDNTDIRAADQVMLGNQSFVYGVTLNNNPTVQDLWNSTPAWGFPYAGAENAPAPMAGTIIDGALGQQVVGLSLYTMWNNLLYAELGAYHASPTGVTRPLSGVNGDVPAGDVIDRVGPYWRLALQKQFGEHYFMIGAYGLSADLEPGANMPSAPAPLIGATNNYSDVAGDFQYEKIYGDGDTSLTVHGTYIHETQKLNAYVADGAADNVNDNLDTARADATFIFKREYSGSLGYFSTTGKADATLYGTSTGKPDSDGLIGELAWMPWLNTKLAVDYTAYNKFDGASKNYDGTGRNASDNNTLYVYAWLIF
jgi:hypothetical protein